ncbi:hypothetical protein [Streptacidiphilus sp. PAMC 29251]
MTVTWGGYGSRDTLKDANLAERDALADAAHGGDWPAVLAMVGTNAELANATRVGGSTGYTALHQAAWHGAPEAVAEQLVAAGAWRTLRTIGGAAAGETAYDIAQRCGHHHLARTLHPQPLHSVPAGESALLREVLHSVIRGREWAAELIVEHRLRLPEVEPLTELREPALWFPVPGFYGGFSIKLLTAQSIGSLQAELEVTSWSRVVEGSGQRHRVRVDGAELMEEGFV